MHFVLSISTDKNVAGIIATLAPIAHEVTVTRYHNPRAYDPHILAEIVQRHGVAVQIEPDSVVALAQARSKAQPTDVVCVTGSLLFLGEIKTRLQGFVPEFS